MHSNADPSTAIYVHIARQPIFDIHRHIFAYELLFREMQGLKLGELDGDRATSSLLSTIFLTESIERIVGNKPCCVNFTENLLLGAVAHSFPRHRMIVEILEDVAPSLEVVAACRRLVDLGYRLALDDFIFKQDLLPLVELADIVKLDYQCSSPDEIEQMIRYLKPCKVKLLAEKVETYAEFAHAQKLGFHYFQGYFFARPESLQIKDIAPSRTSWFNLLAELAGSCPNLRRLEQIITMDVALSYKLLRYINSSYFSLIKNIDSVHQAIVYLGEQKLRRFIFLAVISILATDKPMELMRLSLIRARFCEQLADCCGCRDESGSFFSLGLFSLIDAIMDEPMDNILSKLPLSDEMKNALSRQEGYFAPYLETVVAYERGETEKCFHHLQQLGLDPAQMYKLYLEAVNFSFTVF